jgi:hypothetical protein
MHRSRAMPHSNGNGRNVALPDESRPSWRPQDEQNHRNRRPMSEEDDRFDEDRFAGYWEDRGDRRDWFQSRNEGYPGAFEERYRGGAGDDRIGGRASAPYPERSYGAPRGYGYSDGDRPVRQQLGTGGGFYSSTARDVRDMPALSGHRGKGPSNYQRSDERIREAVCEALTEDDRIDATHVDVSVKAGEVTLAGTVDERAMKRAAEDLVEGISGVKDVQNLLRVDRGR